MSLFDNAKMWDAYKTSNGLKCYFWYKVPEQNRYYVTIRGAHPGILVDGEGKNKMAGSPHAEEYYETRKSYVFEIDVIGVWTEEDEAALQAQSAGQKRRIVIHGDLPAVDSSLKDSLEASSMGVSY